MRRTAAVLLLATLLAACGRGEPSDPDVTPTSGATETALPGGPPVATPDADATPGPIEPTVTTPQDITLGTWNRLGDAPYALTEVAAAVFAGQIWVAGGLTQDGRGSAAVLVYEPAFDRWTNGPQLPDRVHHAALVGASDALYLVGGYAGDGFDRPRATVLRMDLEAGGWVEAPALPEPRAAGAAAWDGRRVLYGGGVGPSGPRDAVLALEGAQWREVGSLSEAREHLAAASDGQGRVWFLGGRTSGLESNRTAVDLLDSSGVRRVGDLPTARGGIAGFWLDGLGGCAVGGEQPSRTFDEVECVSDTGQVTVLPSLQVPRHGLGAAVVDGVAYAVFGGPQPGLAVSGVTEALPPR